MATRVNKILWFGVSTLILLVMIFFADFSRFLEALRAAELIYMAPALFFGLLMFPVMAFSWYRFLNQIDDPISYLKSLRMFMAGQFMNSVTPVGQFGGEPFMAYIIKKNTGLKYEEAFSTVLSADLVNAVPVFSFVIGGAAYMALLGSGSIQQVLLQVFYISTVIVTLGSILVYLLWFRSGYVEGLIIGVLEKVAELLGKGHGTVERLEARFEGVQDAFERIGSSPGQILLVAAVAHFYFIFQVASLYMIMLSIGYKPAIPSLFLVVAIAGVANFTPTPGGSGAYEATIAGILTLFMSIEFATALLAGILLRLTTYWPGLIIGYAALLSLESGGGPE